MAPQSISDAIAAARRGEWSIVLTPTKPIPRSWFPADLHGADVLCLASGGGQQGPDHLPREDSRPGSGERTAPPDVQAMTPQ